MTSLRRRWIRVLSERLGGLTLTVGLLAADLGTAQAQSVIPQASEFQVNLYTISLQRRPAVAVNAAGAFVVVWQSYLQDGSYDGIFARRFDATGASQGTELLVNTFTDSFQTNPAVAIAVDGRFVVVWQSYGPDGAGSGILARRFDSSGAPLAADVIVNSTTADDQANPAVSINAGGQFVVVWQSNNQDGSGDGVFGKRFNSAGASIASEFQLNSYTMFGQVEPAVGLDGNGGFVAAWHSIGGQDGGSTGVFGRRFDGAGVSQATEFQVSTHTLDAQARAAVGRDAAGDFVIAWQSYGQDGGEYGVFARRFSAAGSPQAAEFQVNQYTPYGQRYPAVALDVDGDFVITWQSNFQDGSGHGVFARRFDALSSPTVDEIEVASYATSDQNLPSVAMDATGNFVVAWQSSFQDGSQSGVFAQRFASPTLDVDGDGQTAALTDGLLILRFLFGFTGQTLITGAVGAGCTRCTPTLIQPQLAVAAAKGPVAIPGSEFQVNTYTTLSQDSGDVAMGLDGDFVVAWSSQGQDGDDFGIFAQRFDAAGIAQGVELQVNSFVVDRQSFPAVAVDLDGDFVIVWQSRGLEPGYGVVFRRFNSSGVGQFPSELRANTYTPEDQLFPLVAMAEGGTFVLSWSSRFQDGAFGGVFAQRFNAASAPQGGEFQVNSYTVGSQVLTGFAEQNDGFVAVWQSEDVSFDEILGLRFNALGEALGGELQINSYTSGAQRRGRVAVNEAGAFVVVWDSYGQDGSSDGIFARRFDASGSPQAVEFQVNAFTGGAQIAADVGMDADGDFVVAWQYRDLDLSPNGIFARRFSSAGSADGPEFQVNVHTIPQNIIGLQPRVAMDDDGDFVVVYPIANDGSGLGVFARLFKRPLASFDVDGNGAAGALTDGLLILRFLFGFTGSTLTTGAVGPGCTRCSAAAIEAYLAGLS